MEIAGGRGTRITDKRSGGSDRAARSGSGSHAARTTGEGVGGGSGSQVGKGAEARQTDEGIGGGSGPQVAKGTNESTDDGGEVQIAGRAGVPSGGTRVPPPAGGSGGLQIDKRAPVAKESIDGNTGCQDDKVGSTDERTDVGGVRATGGGIGGSDEARAICEPSEARDRDFADEGAASKKDDEATRSRGDLRVRHAVMEKFVRSGVNKESLGQLGVILTQNAREELRNENPLGEASPSQQDNGDTDEMQVQQDKAPERAEDLDELRKQFVQEHNTLERHLRELDRKSVV